MSIIIVVFDKKCSLLAESTISLLKMVYSAHLVLISLNDIVLVY